jgi:phosphate-selective porin OprO/OprP
LRRNKLLRNKLLLILGLFFLVQASLAEEKTSSEPALKFIGYAQAYYTYWQDGTNEFGIRRARLGLQADVFKNIDCKIQIDATKNPILMDALVDFSLASPFALRIGQFKVPFSQESLAPSSSLDTINRSQPVEKLSPGRDIGSYGRDIGVMASGKFSKVDCFLGVFNGSGINRGDLNKQKDIAARLVIHPLDFIQVVADFYKGLYSSAVGVTPVRRDRSGIELFLNRLPFSLKGEYIFAKDDRTSREGWYVQAGYFILSKKLQSIIKYDSYDKDIKMSGDRSDVATLGLNLFFTENTKFQINYELHRQESGNRSSSALLAQFQAGF